MVPTTVPLAVKVDAPVSVTVTGGTEAPGVKPLAETETSRPGDALFGLADSRLIFCAYKGVRTAAAKSTTSVRQNVPAAVVKNEWDVGKVLPVQAKN